MYVGVPGIRRVGLRAEIDTSPPFGSVQEAHTSQSIDSLKEIAYSVYENMVFGKIKEDVNVAASYPFLSSTLAFGVGFFSLKKTRRFVYYNTLCIFLSEKALLGRADMRVKELRQSMDRLTAETEKLERVSGFVLTPLVYLGLGELV